MRIPFVDLGAQYQKHKVAFDGAINGVIQKSAFIGGDGVRRFEADFASAYGVKHCISCGNGTDAIYIALRMLGIGPGDEVITSAASWISTSEAITQTGARPVFVDVDEFFNIDAQQIEKKITSATRAILPVHLYGQAADMGRVTELCNMYQLKLVEDCAQAHFAEHLGTKAGTFGNAGTFSFYPGKNLGAWGDAGAIVTNDDEFAQQCRMFANHGALVKHNHLMEGINSRLDGIQAAILSAKLPHLGEWTTERRRVAKRYGHGLRGVGDLVLPDVRQGSTHVYHLYVVRTAMLYGLKDFLAAKEMEAAIYYTTALPLLPAYQYMGIRSTDIPNAARNQGEILSLPVYPELSDEMVDYVVDTIRQFYQG